MKINLEAKLFIFAGLALAAVGFLMIDYYLPRMDPIANAMNDNVSFGAILIPYHYVLLCALALIGIGSYRLWIAETEKTFNWHRGLLRLWIFASLAWVTIVAVNIKLPAISDVVHIRFSNTETWDYPVAWGEERIETDLKARIDAKEKTEYDWLATVILARRSCVDLSQAAFSHRLVYLGSFINGPQTFI